MVWFKHWLKFCGPHQVVNKFKQVQISYSMGGWGAGGVGYES